jgi:YbbR domain-containing protein
MGKSRLKRLLKSPKTAIFLVLMFSCGALFALWFFYLRPIDAQITTMVKLTHIPPGLALVGEPAQTIDVRIIGPKSLVAAISRKQCLSYSADLSQIRIGANHIEIEYEKFFFPEVVSIAAITPASLTIVADRKIKKHVPIKIVLSGTPDPGYIVADAVSNPSGTDLKGPESVLAPIKSVKTKPVDIAGSSTSVRKEAALDLPDNIATVFPANRIAAEIIVVENILTQKISGIPVQGKNTFSTYEITPDTIYLEIKGPENLLKKPSLKNEIEVFLDLDGLTPGLYVRHATIRLPADVTLVSVAPETFTVKLNNQ